MHSIPPNTIPVGRRISINMHKVDIFLRFAQLFLNENLITYTYILNFKHREKKNPMYTQYEIVHKAIKLFQFKYTGRKVSNLRK